MAIKTKELRRLHEAAIKDRDEGKFFDELREGLEKKHLAPEDFSIRTLFEEFVEDGREIISSWSRRNGGDGGVRLHESAVNTAAFSNITGQIIYNALMNPHMDEPLVFTPLVETVPTDLSGEKIAGITQIGDQGAVVPEGEPYPIVGVGEDWIETPETTKRGLILPVTKEAIFFDRTGQLIKHARDVGNSLQIGKEKRIIDALVDENTTAHRYKWRGTVYATYQTSSPWDNVTASNALVDWTDLDAAEQTINALIDPWTGEPITINFTHLICTKPLEQTALRIMNATEVRYTASGAPTETIGGNTYKNKYQVATSRLLASRMATDTDWFLSNPRAQVAYMENWPITVVQAPSNSEDEFKRDIVFQWKASERGAAATKEPRAAHKSTVA